MSLVPLDERETRPLEHGGIEIAPVVDDDADRRPRSQRGGRVAEDGSHAVHVLGERLPGGAAGRTAELPLAPLLQPEQLVGVAVLLVVVDVITPSNGPPSASVMPSP